MIGLRNKLLDILLESNLDLDIWIPQAGYFFTTDASRLEILEKYRKSPEGELMARDYSLGHQIAYEKGVITIPCSDFYDQETKIDNYVRFAYCKDDSIIESARAKLKWLDSDWIIFTLFRVLVIISCYPRTRYILSPSIINLTEEASCFFLPSFGVLVLFFFFFFSLSEGGLLSLFFFYEKI